MDTRARLSFDKSSIHLYYGGGYVIIPVRFPEIGA